MATVENIHPRSSEVIAEIDKFYLDNWEFTSEKARKKFVGAGFARLACLIFPRALDDRIELACHILNLGFLIDDVIEHMTFQEGSVYNARVLEMFASKGLSLPDRSKPVEYISYDVWQRMWACDHELAQRCLEPMGDVMDAMGQKKSTEMHSFGSYMTFREKDFGQPVYAALLYLVQDIKWTPEDPQSIKKPDGTELPLAEFVKLVDGNCGKYIAIINDLLSWDKEVMAAETMGTEGATLVSSITLLGKEAGLAPESAKEVLREMCKQWEVQQKEYLQMARASESQKLVFFVEGMGSIMEGFVAWHETSARYRAPGAVTANGDAMVESNKIPPSPSMDVENTFVAKISRKTNGEGRRQSVISVTQASIERLKQKKRKSSRSITTDTTKRQKV